MNRFEEAREVLLPVVGKFPHVPAIFYDLACYACRLGNLPEARQWLARAFTVAEELRYGERTRLLALDDPDLEPLWKEIGSIELASRQ